MNKSLYRNKICFQEQKEKKNAITPFLSLILSVIFLISCLVEIQLSIPMYAIYQEETKSLWITWNLDDVNELSKIQNLKLENNIYPFQITNISEILINEVNKVNYQKIEIKSPQTLRNNQVVKIYLLDQKEKIIKKIIKIIK